MSAGTRKILAVIAALGAAAAVVCIAISGKAPLLGDEFYDPDLKMSFRLPKGWGEAEPDAQLRRVFSKRDRLLVAHFEGPRFGDSCELIVFADGNRLFQVRKMILASDRALKKKTLQDEFGKLNGIPVWMNQFGTGDPPLVLHHTRVVFDRGDKKVMLLFRLTAKSMREQAKAIPESISTVRLD